MYFHIFEIFSMNNSLLLFIILLHQFGIELFKENNQSQLLAVIVVFIVNFYILFPLICMAPFLIFAKNQF